MAHKLFIDLDRVDLTKVKYDLATIQEVNPQRGDMQMLDGILWSKEEGIMEAVGYKDVRSDEFWVPGHIPGRPLLPGVLMIEAAAQLAAFMMKRKGVPKEQFIGFLGCDDVKFRGQVVPGDRLLLLGREVSFRPRRLICEVQGVVRGNLTYEAQITGMPI